MFVAVYAAVMAFAAYVCFYAFRKPFQAAQFHGLSLGPIDLKTALVVAQMLGYALSKFVFVRVGSEVRLSQRRITLLLSVAIAEVALVGFGALPMNLKPAALFANGCSLGIVWGMIARYLEGRRSSDVLFVALSCAYIVGSGIAKDSGIVVLNVFHLSVWWMPAAVGALYFPAFAGLVWLLDQTPEPSARDRQARAARLPMTRADRAALFSRFAVGIAIQAVFYLLISGYRDFRDIFGIEIFAELGYAEVPAVFTRSETIVALVVLAAFGAVVLVRNNRAGLLANMGLMGVGAVIVGLSTWMHDAQQISGLHWIIGTGVGAFLMYVPNGATWCDRLIACSGQAATAAFIIYLMDGFGYLGSIGLQLYKSFFHSSVSFAEFFRQISYGLAFVGAALVAINFWYFSHRKLEPLKSCPTDDSRH